MRFLILLLLLCSSFPRRPWVRTRLAAATARYRVRGRFNEKLLIKQEGEPLNIVDVLTSAVVTVSKTEFITPSAFIFLYENNLFLTFRQRQVTVWNFAGEPVTHFEDHTLWHADTNTNNVFITSAQDYIIISCVSGG